MQNYMLYLAVVKNTALDHEFSDTYFLKQILLPPVNFCLKSLMRPIFSPFPKLLIQI